MINELGYTSIAILSPGYGENKLSADYFIKECHQLGVILLQLNGMLKPL